MESKIYSISEVARRAGLSPNTLRSWEQTGVIPKPTRLRGGNGQIRLYSEDDIKAIRAIKAMRKKNFASIEKGSH